jgi:hypothetical protein
LALDGVVPIPPDQEALDTIMRATDERVISVNMTQKHMIDTYKEQEDLQEKEFYYEVCSSQDFYLLIALSVGVIMWCENDRLDFFVVKIRKNFNFKKKKMDEWKNYILRTSKYSMLESCKEKQNAAIQDSRLPEKETADYQTIHNLEIPNLAVTVRFFCIVFVFSKN